MYVLSSETGGKKQRTRKIPQANRIQQKRSKIFDRPIKIDLLNKKMLIEFVNLTNQFFIETGTFYGSRVTTMSTLHIYEC